MERIARLVVSNKARRADYERTYHCGACCSSLDPATLGTHRCGAYGGVSAEQWLDLFWEEA